MCRPSNRVKPTFTAQSRPLLVVTSDNLDLIIFINKLQTIPFDHLDETCAALEVSQLSQAYLHASNLLVCPGTHCQLSTLPETRSGRAGEKRRPEQNHLRSTPDLPQTGTDLRLGLGSALWPHNVDRPHTACRLRRASDSPRRARVAGAFAHLHDSVRMVLGNDTGGATTYTAVRMLHVNLHRQPSRKGSSSAAGCTCRMP